MENMWRHSSNGAVIWSIFIGTSCRIIAIISLSTLFRPGLCFFVFSATLLSATLLSATLLSATSVHLRLGLFRTGLTGGSVKNVPFCKEVITLTADDGDNGGERGGEGGGIMFLEKELILVIISDMLSFQGFILYC